MDEFLKVEMRVWDARHLIMMGVKSLRWDSDGKIIVNADLEVGKRFILMESIGRRDGSGHLIYVGDCLRMRSGGSVFCGDVVYNGDTASYRLRTHHFDSIGISNTMKISREDEIEVIGDIYRNPLLVDEMGNFN